MAREYQGNPYHQHTLIFILISQTRFNNTKNFEIGNLKKNINPDCILRSTLNEAQYKHLSLPNDYLTQLAEAVEYTDCISAEG